MGLTSTLAYDVIAKTSTAAPEVIEAQAAPWGVLSILIIFIIGGGTYFFLLPRYLKKDEKGQ